MLLDALAVAGRRPAGESQVRAGAYVVRLPGRIVKRDGEQHVGVVVGPACGQGVVVQDDHQGIGVDGRFGKRLAQQRFLLRQAFGEPFGHGHAISPA